MKKLIALTIVLTTASATLSAQNNSGCRANISSKPSDNFRMTSYSGNTQLDNFLNREVNVLRTFYGINPSVYYYQDEAAAPNAQAIPRVEDYSHPSGTVILGLNMVTSEFRLSTSGTTIPFILAHEFAHIVDFNKGAISGYETRISELFADFNAGCFLYYRSFLTYTDIQAALRSFYNKGDYEFNNPDHHGTPEERLNAVLAGYNWLKGKARPGVNIGTDEAIKAAKEYLGISGTTSSQSPTKSSSSQLTSHVSLIAKLLSPSSDGRVTTYTYSVKIYNRNDVDIHVSVGGLTYGHYQNCNANTYNYVKDGNFDEQGISVSANSNETIEFTMTFNENPPYFCSGVPSYQRAKIISVEEE